MSTGQPPSGDKSGGEKKSNTGQLSSKSAAEKPDAKHVLVPSVDDNWDPRETPAPGIAAAAGGGATATTGQPGRSTLPPTSSSGKGRFTVGNLLNATQGGGPTSKRSESQHPVHRQQIGALPHRPVTRDPVSAASASMGKREQPSASPASPGIVSGVRARPLTQQRKTTPPQPFAAQPARGAISSEPRNTPPQFAAIAAPAVEPAASSRPLAAFTLEPAPERTTPSQPFAAFTLEPTTDRAIPSQPFTALASPMVSVGPEIPEPEEALSPGRAQAPQVTGVRAELNASDLLAPELHEPTPRGIGVVTISSPAPAIQPAATASSAKVAAAPIIPIATVPIGERAEPGATIAERTLPSRSQTAGDSVKSARVVPVVAAGSPLAAAKSNEAPVSITTPPPAAVAVHSRPPPAAPVLDDPDGWEIPADTATTASSGEPPPPVAPNIESAAPRNSPAATADAKRTRADSAARKSAAKVALEKARASKGKLKASKAVDAELPGKKTPSSNSRLLRAGNAETELSGEFFAAAAIDQPELAAGSYHEDVLDERARRSLSPEVVARRGRYRVVVVLVILGFLLLLGAAIALKVLHPR